MQKRKPVGGGVRRKAELAAATLALTLPTSSLVSACSDEFNDCRSTHTCPRTDANGGQSSGSGGEAPDVTAGSPSAEAAGQGGMEGAVAMENPICSPTATPARLMSPPSSSLVTSRQPTVTWELGDDCGALTVDFCLDRSCSDVFTSLEVNDGDRSARPALELPLGVVFWRVVGSGVGSAVWQFNVGAGTQVDTTWETLPDFNGDGLGDVAVGTSDGSVFIYYGAYGAKDGFDATPTVLSLSGESDFAFGDPIASGGDVNGDGFTDLVVGAPKLAGDGAGKLHFYAGGPSGIVDTAFSVVDELGLFDGTDPFGPASVIRGGADINQDGYGDVVVTTARVGTSSGTFTPYYGGPRKILGGSRIDPGNGADVGRSAAFCDLNADRLPDLVLGAPDASNNYQVPTPVLIYEGNGASFAFSQSLLADAGFGATVACGDYTGDGHPDVIAGRPASGSRGYENGDIEFFDGSGTLSSSGTSLPGQGDSSYANSGRLVVTVGDMNGDGIHDVASAEYSNGAIRVFFRPGSGKLTDTIEIPGEVAAADSLTSADINGDGLTDLIVSISEEVSVYLGSTTSRVLVPSTIRIEAPPGTMGFGRVLGAAL